MSHEGLQTIIGMAIVDRGFCNALLGCPAEVAQGWGLSDEELAVVSSIKVRSLEQFAARIDLWLSKMPVRREQRPLSSPWSTDLLRVAG